MKLNLGCGDNKIQGFINIDLNPDLKPDVVCNLLTGLPYEDSSCDEILLFHTIEHIQKRLHPKLFAEIRRVLKPEGVFILSFPEFSKIAKNWLENKGGERPFWEATIYGRQLHIGDYHLCAMDITELKVVLKEIGLEITSSNEEPGEYYNTVVFCKKVDPFKDYEIALKEDMEAILT